MSEAVNKNLGHATAYGYAKSKGYIGTEEEYAELMASYGTVAQAAAASASAAAQAKTGAEEAQEAAETAAASALESEGRAEEAESDAAESARSAATSASAASQAKSEAEAARAGAESAQSGAEAAERSVETKAAAAISAIETAGSEQTASIQQTGAGQAASIRQAGSDQVDAVETAGSEQVDAVEQKGEEVLQSIPSDYTDLSDDVSRIKGAISELEAGSLSALDAEDKQVPLADGNGSWAWGDILKAPAIWEDASGDIVTFEDGAEGMPLRECVVSVDPVQDLHGYDYPWPAGGGKNILPTILDNIKQRNTSGIWNNNVYTYNGLTFTIITDQDGNITGINVNGTANEDADFIIISLYTFPSGSYALNGCPSGGSTSTYRIFATSWGSDTGSGVTATLDGSTATTIRISIKSGTEVSNQVYKPMVRFSSVTDATFAPYSNICPITGWTGAKVSRTGKNLYNFDEQALRSNNTYLATNLPHNTNFVFSTNTQITGLYISYSDDETMPFLTGATGWTNINYRYNTTFVPFNSGKHRWYRLVTYEIGGVQERPYQLELGSTATDYEPYQGVTYDITFPAEAGTVYGGTLDVVRGTLTVDMAMIDLGDANWNSDQNRPGVFYRGVSGRKFASSVIACTEYNVRNISVTTNVDYYISGANSYGGGVIFVRDTRYSGNTAAEFRIAVSGVMIVYELATPITYQLTPQQIRTLFGINNIWADTGDTAVTYPVDTELFVNGKAEAIQTLRASIAPVEDGATASKAYAQGEYFFRFGSFCKAKTAIASEAQFTLNTNYEVTTVASELFTSINS